MGRQHWRKLFISLVLQALLSHALLHWHIVQLFFSSFVLHVSVFRCYQLDLKSLHGGHQVWTEEVIYSKYSPSCKTSLFTKVAKWHTFTNVAILGEIILHCNVQSDSWCLKISDQNLGNSAWATRCCCLSPSAEKLLLSYYYRGQKDARCDVEVKGPTLFFQLLEASSGNNKKEDVSHALLQPVLVVQG